MHKQYVKQTALEHSGRRGVVDREFGLYFGGFGPRDGSQRRGNGREKLGDRFSGPGDHSGPISNHFRRFRARPPLCDLKFDDDEQLRLLRLEHCDIATVETSETSTLCVETKQMSVLATEDICPVSAADIRPVSTADICPVSQKTSILSQQKTRRLPAAGRLLLCLLLRQDRCLLLRQDRCLLLRQDRCLLLRQDRCCLLYTSPSPRDLSTSRMPSSA